MLKHAKSSDADDFIVATEVGILHQMEKQNPEKRFIPANRQAICPFMKMITLEKVRDALKDNKHPITVEDDIAQKATIAIERMISIG